VFPHVSDNDIPNILMCRVRYRFHKLELIIYYSVRFQYYANLPDCILVPKPLRWVMLWDPSHTTTLGSSSADATIQVNLDTAQYGLHCHASQRGRNRRKLCALRGPARSPHRWLVGIGHWPDLMVHRMNALWFEYYIATSIPACNYT